MNKNWEVIEDEESSSDDETSETEENIS